MKTLGFPEVAKAAKFRKFCRLLCEISGLELVFVSPNPRIRDRLDYSGEKAFLCKYMRGNPRFNKECLRCDTSHCEAAMRGRGAFHYKCHAGLTDLVVPLRIDGIHVGLLMGGELFDSPPTEKSFYSFERRLAKYGFEKAELQNLFMRTQWMEPRRMRSIVELAALFSEHFSELGSRLLEPQGRKGTLEDALEFLRLNFMRPIGLDDCARAVGVSPQHLSSLLSADGDGFSRRLRSLRIERAKRLLESSDYELSRVASESGFGSQRSFNRAFRDSEGVSPSVRRGRSLRGRN
jgi:AraC-like DNA-binding protein